MSTPFGRQPPRRRDDARLVELLRYLESQIDDEYSLFVDEELQRFRIQISPAARLMVALPLYEVSRLDSAIYNHQETRSSITKLLNTMAEDPAYIDASLGPRINPFRSTLSVIKAYWSRFCNIPPFCGER
jgi:hypothetical protein